MSQRSIDRWIPEICYEDNGEGVTSHIPFIPVPENEEMPRVLFIFSSRETGEFEPGNTGEDGRQPRHPPSRRSRRHGGGEVHRRRRLDHPGLGRQASGLRPGEEVPVVELDLHQYADMNTLRDRLPLLLYNNVRLALGLETLETAVQKGRQITDSIREKLTS